MIKHFEANAKGRDFVVGDIHGCFSLLDEILGDVDFDPSADRLFSVGDLVDRGPEPGRALEFLGKSWFHAVRGNHEQMAIDWAAGHLDPHNYNANGGGWNISNPPHIRQQYADAFEVLPLGIEVETTAGLVGIVHADCPYPSWGAFRAAVNDGYQLEAIGNMCMWSRDRATEARDDGIIDLHALIVGHTPMQRVTSLGNVLFIDTGACFEGALTIIDISRGVFENACKPENLVR